MNTTRRDALFEAIKHRIEERNQKPTAHLKWLAELTSATGKAARVTIEYGEPDYGRNELEKELVDVAAWAVDWSATWMPTNDVLIAVVQEHEHQDAKWGANRMMHNLFWLSILVEEVGEASRATIHMEGWGDNPLRSELIQVAASAVAWLEELRPNEVRRSEN